MHGEVAVIVKLMLKTLGATVATVSHIYRIALLMHKALMYGRGQGPRFAIWYLADPPPKRA